MNFPQLYKDLKSLLIQTIRNKLENYHPETENMPFHWRLLGRDRYAMFSFIQSVNTTFGTSLWEQEVGGSNPLSPSPFIWVNFNF